MGGFPTIPVQAAVIYGATRYRGERRASRADDRVVRYDERMKCAEDGVEESRPSATALKLPELRDIRMRAEIVPRTGSTTRDPRARQRYKTLLFERFPMGRCLTNRRRLAEWETGTVSWSARSGTGARRENTAVDGLRRRLRFPERTLLAPDATYISRERWAARRPERTFAHAVRMRHSSFLGL